MENGALWSKTCMQHSKLPEVYSVSLDTAELRVTSVIWCNLEQSLVSSTIFHLKRETSFRHISVIGVRYCLRTSNARRCLQAEVAAKKTCTLCTFSVSLCRRPGSGESALIGFVYIQHQGTLRQGELWVLCLRVRDKHPDTRSSLDMLCDHRHFRELNDLRGCQTERDIQTASWCRAALQWTVGLSVRAGDHHRGAERPTSACVR